MRRDLSVRQSSNGSGVCCKRVLEACKRGSEALQSVLIRGPTWVPLAPSGFLNSRKDITSRELFVYPFGAAFFDLFIRPSCARRADPRQLVGRFAPLCSL